MRDENKLYAKIDELKKKKNALVLAHYYQTYDIQKAADITGDSHELAVKASCLDCDIIVLCGVSFMAESAKILNPAKKVLTPAPDAGCPMADMITSGMIASLRKEHPGAAVVCYVNSSAETKAASDICCTSSNAQRVVRSLSERDIIFVPDKNLGHYIASIIPEKNFIFIDGTCPVHNTLSENDVRAAAAAHPDALLAVHPECPPEICALADFAGSTSQILDYCAKSSEREFIIGTETGVAERLSALYPEKKFYLLSPSLICRDMKKTTLEGVLETLENESGEVALPDKLMKTARLPLERMIDAAK